MAELTITKLDDDLLRAIRRRAEALGGSVDDTLNDLIRLALLHDTKGRVAVADRIRAKTLKPYSEDSTDVIRRHRDGGTARPPRVPPEEAVRISREMRSRFGNTVLPDSTPGIRRDRDTR